MTEDHTARLGPQPAVTRRCFLGSCAAGAAALLAMSAFAVAAERPGTYRPNPAPPTDKRIGSNYTPAYAVNQVQMWHDFRPKVVEKELAAARRYYGITMLRVFLHAINFREDRENLLRNMETFLGLCARHDIQPGFVFFDDCHRHKGITLDRPTEPVKGYHNGRWAACPQDRTRKPESDAGLQAYVREVVGRYKADKRVLFWEIFNEPGRGAYSRALVAKGYKWAKEAGATQPVLCCWNDGPHTDIVDAHNYSSAAAGWDKQADMNPRKGTVFTEAGARWYAGKSRSHGTPVEVIGWLTRRKAARKSQPGAFLCWELMVGNSNCRWVWGTKAGSPEPTIPWCGLLWPDATPVSLAESEACLRYAAGKGRALFFDDFHVPAASPKRAAARRPGWAYYGGDKASGGSLSGVFALGPHEKRIAGKEAWADYVVEANVMLKEPGGNAGLVFRACRPGDGTDRMRGYYVGFDTSTLFLGRMNNDWKELARFDLRKLECKVAPGSWCLLRVAAQGNAIKVWFNRMHGERNAGLRIHHKDTDAPMLRGAVGVRTHNASAWFDDVVVLPLDARDAAILGEPNP